MAKPALADATVSWEPRSKPQAALIACPVFEVFFGGSRGSLKTDSVLGDWISHSDLYGEAALGLMVRRTREELKETFERARQMFTPLGYKFSGYVAHGPSGSRLTFAYLDNDSDADRYMGWSLTRVYVEEIGNFPNQAPVMKLMATLRSPTGVPCGFRSTGNPGGPGHHWVKERYISPAPKGWEVQTYEYINPFDQSVVTKDRVFIPGRITDHDLLGPEYIANLQMSGNENLVRAWLLGDWDVIEGAFFDNWSDKMVLRPFTIPDHWLRFISGDWGFAAPFSFGWWAVASEDYHHPEGVIPRGAMVRYREWYGAKSANVGIRMNAEDAGAELRKKSKGESLSIGVLDPAMFATQSGPSIAERLMLGANHKLTFRAGDNKRVGPRGAMGGWDQMRGRMAGVEGRPMIYCFSTCTDSIRTIPVLQHDKDKAEDLDTTAEDHCFVAGTMVDTDCGPTPIEHLIAGKHAVWSAGRWRWNYRSRLTRLNADVLCLRFDNGRIITCTPDHRFMDCSGEWRYARDLLDVEVSCDQQLLAKRYKSSVGYGITAVASTIRTVVLGFTGLFGKRSTVQSQRARISTIRMATDQTMRPTTLNALRCRSIWAAHTARKVASVAGCHSIRPETRLPNGMALRLVENGTASITSSIYGQSWIDAWLQRAKSVAMNIWCRLRGLNKESTVAITVAPVRCVSVEGAGKANVYCLNEPETQAFTVEGGLIVHNCADEWRYACMSRPYTRSKPGEPKPVHPYEGKGHMILGNIPIRELVAQQERRMRGD